MDATDAAVAAEVDADVFDLEAWRARLLDEECEALRADGLEFGSDTTAGLLADADPFVTSFAERVAQVAGKANERGLARLLAAHERLRRGVEASMATTINTIDDRGNYFVDGHRRVGSFVKASVRYSDAEVTRQLRVARLLRTCPRIGELLAAGELGIAQAAELGRLLNHPRIDNELVVGALDGFVDHAQRATYESFRNLTCEWERLIDQDGSRRDADKAHRDRDVTLSTLGEAVFLDGKFGTAQGTVLKEIFERFVEAEFRTDWDAAKAKYGDDVCVDLLPRTAAQRRADALLAMALAAAGAPLDGKQPEIVVNILVDQHTFETETAAATGEPSPPPPPPANTPAGSSTDTATGTETKAEKATRPRRCCQTLDGTPIDPSDAFCAGVVGYVRRVVIGSDGVIINMGRKQRLFRGSARTAAKLRAGLDHQGRCGWPGCYSRHCQIDHVLEWIADDGGTNIDNAGDPCSRHNRWKHRHGYAVRRDPNGYWHTYRPDGTEIDPY